MCRNGNRVQIFSRYSPKLFFFNRTNEEVGEHNLFRVNPKTDIYSFVTLREEDSYLSIDFYINILQSSKLIRGHMRNMAKKCFSHERAKSAYSRSATSDKANK